MAKDDNDQIAVDDELDSPTPFPDREKYVFKPKFEERYKALLGEDNYKRFIDYSLSFKRRGIRVNTLKTSVKDIKKRLSKSWNLIPVPWYSDAFWIEHKGTGDDHRRDVGNLIEHALGYIYIQDPASAIPPLVLDPKPGEKVLDMCAAPGSKTTQMSQLMNNTGIIVANEIIGTRIAALGVNVQRMGSQNVMISQADATRLPKVMFDKILLDAPCSGVGTIRKSPRTINMWNPGMIQRLVLTQQKLLEAAYERLAPGGTIVYSTCTTEPEENEGIVSWFVKKYPDMSVAPIKLDIVRSPPVTEFAGEVYDSQVKNVLRIWPYDNDTEGFFVSKLVKKK
ncbi:MAG TPA: RsmB/NOP family class I SAM-dependent RNA methyltransferase [Acidobacteriota bacterium]|nr:RsmB/NOP family class I SAM-dependent RNA methyltransferase [Acidobacteriota bacterium]